MDPCGPPWFDSLSGFSDVRATVPDAEADDDELGWIARPHADLDVQASELLFGKRVEHLVDADVKGVLRLVAEQRALAPRPCQEVGDRALELLPKRQIVRLEHGAANPLLDRFLEIEEQAADVHVLPVGIAAIDARRAARAP